jgi:hypothetical protein
MKIASKIVTTFAGLLFIVAVCLKIHQILTVPMPTEPLVDTWLFVLIQIPLELGLGIWLLSGLFKKEAWLLTLIGYACFIGVTSWRFATGQESCGCFGTFHLDPKITLFTIDIPIFLALAIFRPRHEKFLQWPTAKHFILIALPTAIILSSLVPTLIFNKPEAEIIDPAKWIEPQPTKPEPNVANDNNEQQSTPVEPEAKKWELLDKIDIADVISSGMNITILYRHDCDKCHEALPQFEEYANEFGTDDDSIRIVFVELPPFGESTGYVIPEDTKCLKGRYTDEKAFISTPVIVVTLDGAVQKIWTSENDIPTFDDLMEAMMGE